MPPTRSAAHVDPENTLELEEGALHAALLAGLGFAAMPRSVVEQDIAEGRLVVIPLPGRSVSQSFAAARRRDLHTPAVEAFWAHLKRIAVTSPEERPQYERASSA